MYNDVYKQAKNEITTIYIFSDLFKKRVTYLTNVTVTTKFVTGGVFLISDWRSPPPDK